MDANEVAACDDDDDSAPDVSGFGLISTGFALRNKYESAANGTRRNAPRTAESWLGGSTNLRPETSPAHSGESCMRATYHVMYM